MAIIRTINAFFFCIIEYIIKFIKNIKPTKLFKAYYVYYIWQYSAIFVKFVKVDHHINNKKITQKEYLSQLLFYFIYLPFCLMCYLVIGPFFCFIHHIYYYILDTILFYLHSCFRFHFFIHTFLPSNILEKQKKPNRKCLASTLLVHFNLPIFLFPSSNIFHFCCIFFWLTLSSTWLLGSDSFFSSTNIKFYCTYIVNFQKNSI